MTILLVLIPITLLFVVAGGFAFFWAVNHDQFDDMETPALLPLTDSPPDRDGQPDRDRATRSEDHQPEDDRAR